MEPKNYIHFKDDLESIISKLNSTIKINNWWINNFEDIVIGIILDSSSITELKINLDIIKELSNRKVFSSICWKIINDSYFYTHENIYFSKKVKKYIIKKYINYFDVTIFIYKDCYGNFNEEEGEIDIFPIMEKWKLFFKKNKCSNVKTFRLLKKYILPLNV